MAAEKTTMQVTIVASDRPVWSGTATSVTVPASEGGMGILPNHEPVLVVVNSGRVVVVETDGSRHGFDVEDGFVAFDSNKLTVAVEHCSDETAVTAE
ncbi:ATP synthase epsilon subunit [Bifidobacterium sp. DSM 109958]|uniref:ATP synthase epsilon subunit n=1 Tax=Bifidobacterium moraviense TaxID=2675323 RepID=A0A7Y0F1L0_9BIFI|nr:F0F1 ATP synthase subunit epsilon [Bifidobacterium sp. DSM 109958]NMN00331.1 ATP synthase epsilon subunit [Bifidobacterium sp. DSM 109958]